MIERYNQFQKIHVPFTWTSNRIACCMYGSVIKTPSNTSMSCVAKSVADVSRFASTNPNDRSKHGWAKMLAYKKLLNNGSRSACYPIIQTVFSPNLEFPVQVSQKIETSSQACQHLAFMYGAQIAHKHCSFGNTPQAEPQPLRLPIWDHGKLDL